LARIKRQGGSSVGVEEAKALYGIHSPQKTGTGAGRGGWAGTTPPGRGLRGGLRGLTRILAGLAGLLVLVILAGTFYALFRNPGGPVSEESPPAGSDPRRAADGAVQNQRASMFTGIGRLRITAGAGADSAPPPVVILSVVFPYPPEDRPFTEELAGKIPLFRRIIRDYFGALARGDLNPLDEQGAKDELRRRFNGELHLGSIESLLFSDLMILE
jgi:flagellar basal body-associated protein FliL